MKLGKNDNSNKEMRSLQKKKRRHQLLCCFLRLSLCFQQHPSKIPSIPGPGAAAGGADAAPHGTPAAHSRVARLDRGEPWREGSRAPGGRQGHPSARREEAPAGCRLWEPLPEADGEGAPLNWAGTCRRCSSLNDWLEARQTDRLIKM